MEAKLWQLLHQRVSWEKEDTQERPGEFWVRKICEKRTDFGHERARMLLSWDVPGLPTGDTQYLLCPGASNPHYIPEDSIKIKMKRFWVFFLTEGNYKEDLETG